MFATENPATDDLCVTSFPIPHPASGHIKHRSRCTNSIISSAASLGGSRRHSLIVGPLTRCWLLPRRDTHPSQRPGTSRTNASTFCAAAASSPATRRNVSLMRGTLMCHMHAAPSVSAGFFLCDRNPWLGQRSDWWATVDPSAPAQEQMDAVF